MSDELKIPRGVRWNATREHWEEEVCLGCGQPSRLPRDCGCPAGTGWRKWQPESTDETIGDST